MAVNGHRGWHTLHGEGRRLVSDDGLLAVKCQVRTMPNGTFGNRFIEINDDELGIVMCLAFSVEQHLIGQTFGQTQNEARSAMEAVFARKGLGTTGLTFKGKSSANLDQTAAEAFIAARPPGEYTTYQDVAEAGGVGQYRWGALRASQWLAREIEPGSIPNAYAVLNSDGTVNRSYKSVAPNMPQTPKDAESKLMSEGLSFDARGRADKSRHWTVERWRATSGVTAS